MADKKEMLICVASKSSGSSRSAVTGNNNKFYYAELNGSTINIKYGRVGTDGTTSTKHNQSERDFDKLIQGKIKRGYVKAEIDLESDGEEVSLDRDLMAIALDQIQSDKHAEDLIKKLVKKNIHNITNNTKITFNMDTGVFKTPLGIVTKKGVDKAMDLLNKLADYVDDNGIKKGKREDTVRGLSEDYFKIIPTKIADLKPIRNHLITNQKISDQLDICNALLQSIDLVDSEKDKATQEAKDKKEFEKVFDTSLTLLEDQKEFDRIVKYFEDSKNKQHGYRTSNAKIKRIFNMRIEKDEVAFRDDMKNVQSLFHGTKICNLLSIMKSGLLMPKQVATAQITGAMFGSGLYFANQSSKSLNYCDGMYWNNTSRDDNVIYMFLADVALGEYQVPKGCTSRMPDKGYDSYWAKAGKSGVMNDEIIVFKNEQIRLTHLMEIELT